jgi:gluconate kinase
MSGGRLDHERVLGIVQLVTHAVSAKLRSPGQPLNDSDQWRWERRQPSPVAADRSSRRMVVRHRALS